MCKTPKMPAVKVDRPDYLRNPFLDEGRDSVATVNAIRAGRSALTIPLGQPNGIGFTGRGGSLGAQDTTPVSGLLPGRRGGGTSAPNNGGFRGPRVQPRSAGTPTSPSSTPLRLR